MEELLKNPELLSLKNSLAGVMIVLVGHLLLKVGLEVYKATKKKVDTSEETLKLNTKAIEDLTSTTKATQEQSAKFQVAMDKLSYDLQKAFYILKQNPEFTNHLRKFKEEQDLNK